MTNAKTHPHIALLCAVNVGGGGKLPMARQREIAEALGWADVRVHLQTGNIVFRPPAGRDRAELAAELEERLRTEVGRPTGVVMRTRDELAGEIAANPYPEATAVPKSLHLVFLSDTPANTAGLDAIDPAAFAPDSFRLLGRVVYLHCPDGVGRSKLAARIGGSAKPAGVLATARNWNTSTRLLALADEI
jgi:uncharacterized protein (DUF1697 family)